MARLRRRASCSRGGICRHKLVASRSMSSQSPWRTASGERLPDARPLVLIDSAPLIGGPETRKSAWTISNGAQTGPPSIRFSPSAHRIGRCASKPAPGSRGSPSTSTTGQSSRISANVASRRRARTCSACHVSAASISAEALAAAMSIPLPLNTALDRAFGRQTMTTGMPVRSSPVRLATRVIPRTSLCARTRAIVSSAVKARIARGS